MPRAVSSLKKNGYFLDVKRILSMIVNEYETDFSKCKKLISPERLIAVFREIALQSGNKFTYKNLTHSYNYTQINECLIYLKRAGLIIPVYHTSASGIPLGSGINDKISKYLIFDYFYQFFSTTANLPI